MAHTEHDSHHVIPLKILLRVFGALVVLTVLTVAVSRIDLGALETPVALGIAGVKAALVVLFFMALKYDKGVNSMVFTIGTVFVAVFLFFTMLDVTFRGDLSNMDSATISADSARVRALRAQEPPDSLLRIAPGDYTQPPGGTSVDAPVTDSASVAGASSPDPGAVIEANDTERTAGGNATDREH